MSSTRAPKPLIVLTGFLGSGKTTLLDRILHDEAHQQRLAVIQNEYASGVGVDNELTASGKAVCTAEIYETASGCLCCGGRGDFIQILHQLSAHAERFDQLIVETTGLADPSFMQALFVDETLRASYKLASVVCLVDVQRIAERLDAKPTTLEDGMEIVNEAVEQLCHADKIIMNKCDLVPPSELDALQQRLASLNPHADIVRARFGATSDGDAALQLLQLAASEVSLERLQAHDSKFLEFRPYRAHHADISSLAFASHELPRAAVEAWLQQMIAHYGRDLYRYKGVLAVEGVPQRCVLDGCAARSCSTRAHSLVLQGVADRYALREGRAWGADESKTCSFVMIGAKLRSEHVADTFLATTGRAVRWQRGSRRTPPPASATVALRLALLALLVVLLLAPETTAALFERMLPGSTELLWNPWLVLVVGALALTTLRAPAIKL